jgi:integrase
MRFSEIVGLRRSQLDYAKNRIILTDTKNNETRSVPLVGHARDELRKVQKVTALSTELVFPAFDEKGNAKLIDIRKPWNAAVKAAGLADFRFHDLRHTAASYLAMNGATLPELAAILGHKGYQMVKRYAHFADGHTKAVVAKMNKSIFGA